MVKKFIILFLIPLFINAQPEFSGISSKPGAFSRIGFGARGTGMGNALSAVTKGNLISYFNPALGAFQNGNSFQTSYTFLTLDRSLNFVGFTRNFEFGAVETADGNLKPRSVAGISAGIINAGVSKIDGRDREGRKTGDLSTSENQFFVALSNRFTDKLTLGVAFKFYYFKLYEDLTANSLGFDVGAIYSVNRNLNISLVLTDINSQYEWDTSKLYGQSGSQTKSKFPLLKKIGAAYSMDEPSLIVAAEIENSNAGANYIRAGVEYNIYPGLFLRGGIDKLDLSNADFPARPSLGFSYLYKVNSITFGFDYAFALEPYSAGDVHIIGLNILF